MKRSEVQRKPVLKCSSFLRLLAKKSAGNILRVAHVARILVVLQLPPTNHRQAGAKQRLLLRVPLQWPFPLPWLWLVLLLLIVMPL